jgi:hypothetical protein
MTENKEKLAIIDVWNYNFKENINQISKLVEKYLYVSVVSNLLIRTLNSLDSLTHPMEHKHTKS